jgi:hypothetical protein
MELFGKIGRRTFLSFSARVAACFAVVPRLAGESSEAAIAPSQPVPLPANLLRISFGVNDTSPQAWDGELRGNFGHFKVAADHFRADDYKELVSDASPFPGTKQIENITSPSDYIANPSSWICSTRRAPQHGQTTEWHVRPEASKPVIEVPSILIRQEAQASPAMQVKTLQGEFSVDPGQVQPFQPLSLLDGRVRVDYVPPTSPVTTGRFGQQDFPCILATDAGIWVTWQEYDGKSDSILVQQKVEGKADQLSVIAQGCDAFHVKLGEDKFKRIWVVWSMRTDGKWGLYGRVMQPAGWSPVQKLTRHADSEIYHSLTTDSTGRLWLVWQRNSRSSQIFAKYFDGEGWSQDQQISEGVSVGGNNWWPDVAAGPEGSLVVVWDGYASGKYDIYLRRFVHNQWQPVETVTSSARFHAHPTVAVGPTGLIWVAWDESEENWGKDVGFLVPSQASPLHRSRSIQLVCLDGNKRMTTTEPVSQVLTPEGFWELPHLQLDRDGCPWLFIRHLTMRQPDTPLEAPIDMALWEIFATKYDGSKWLPLLCLPFSTGRNDMHLSSTSDRSGNLWIAWPTDNRTTKSFEPHQLCVQMARLPQLPPAGAPSLKPLETLAKESEALHRQEARQVKRIREYQIECRGRKFNIFRGDLHRHTDNSADGHNDGSLLDAYRYARDAAALDFLGITDHDDNAMDPYNWWRAQKVANMFQIKDAFAAFYSYERSIPFPNGHKNIFFSEPGRHVTPVLSTELDAWEGAETLYTYLRSVNGFAISHTTGRTSGTDWRDNDPEVESVVEIYQGMRDTYEYPGAPRPFRHSDEWADGSKPVPRASSSEASASFRRQGFVSNAFARGHKLGFIASSDHLSCHVSYACILAEGLSSKSLADAIKARRTYAATDNIILDISYYGSDGQHLMGEAFVSTNPLEIRGKIYGTAPLEKVDIISNGKSVASMEPGQSQFEFHFIDEKPSAGERYFYVRVIQKDGGMAWGSPAWVTYGS